MYAVEFSANSLLEFPERCLFFFVFSVLLDLTSANDWRPKWKTGQIMSISNVSLEKNRNTLLFRRKKNGLLRNENGEKTGNIHAYTSWLVGRALSANSSTAVRPCSLVAWYQVTRILFSYKMELIPLTIYSTYWGCIKKWQEEWTMMRLYTRNSRGRKEDFFY